MSRKDDLEKLIRDSYQVLHENDSQIQIVGPKEKLGLQKENDRQWQYIKNYLEEYTNLCEHLELSPPDDLLQIATHYPDLVTRLLNAPICKRKPTPPRKGFNAPSSPHQVTPFRMNYHFARQFALADSDLLTQFLITFSNRGDADFSQVDVATHICLVLDVSGSMDHPDKYPYLLEAIPYVIQSLSDNDWLSIVLFSSRSELVWSRDVASSRGLESDIIRRINQSGVKFGQTHLAPGLKLALKEVGHFGSLGSHGVDSTYGIKQ